MHVKLKILHGSNAGKIVTIREPQFCIGRSEECNLRINSDAISRRHCTITVSESGIRIRDLKSRNGTHVNGKRIEAEHPVQIGDQLRVGPLEFLVTSVEPKKGAPANTAAASVNRPRGIKSDEEMADMVSDWLEEADGADQRQPLADGETREFKLDETEKLKVDQPQSESETTATSDLPPGKDSAPAGPRPNKPKGRGKEAPKDTQEAAAQMLRKFFNRG